jgi:CPA2 family monovalent cation:H+ antiporter-2
VSGAHTFVQDLAVIFGVAAAATLLFQRLRQPPVLGYLLAGLIVGPHTPVPVFVASENVETLSELGVILVIFSIGLEFDLRKLARSLPTAGVAGAIQIGGMLSLGFAAGKIAGWNDIESLFLGGGVAISSTMIAVPAIRAAGSDDRVQESVISLLVFQDLAAIVLIAVLTAVASGAGLPPSEVAAIFGALLLFIGAVMVAGMLIVPRLIREAHHRGHAEPLLIATIAVCFGISIIGERLGYSLALGAFLAGSLVAESGRRHQVEHQIAPIRDLFAAVFFVSIGMMVDLGAMAESWGMIVAITVLVLLGQATIITVGSFLAGKSVRVSVQTGMALAQIGEFSFIIIGIGTAAGAIPDRLLAIAVGVAAITTFLTPHLVAASGPMSLLVERRLPRRLQMLIALYGGWIESMRHRAGGSPSRLRRQVAFFVLDVVVIAVVMVGAAVERERIGAFLASYLDISARMAGGLAVVAALVAMLPFVVGLARSGRRIGLELASRAVPRSEAGLDLGAAPRRALAMAIEIALALVVTVPLMALSLPFLPLYVGAIAIAVIVAGLGWSLWRSAANLHGHVRAGAEVVLEALDRQRGPTEPAAALPDLLPGLGPLVTVAIHAGTPAEGKTLAEINLRGLTGATVIAINRDQSPGVAVPSGREALVVGDRLTLTGSSSSIEKARRLLAGLPLEDQPESDAQN